MSSAKLSPILVHDVGSDFRLEDSLALPRTRVSTMWDGAPSKYSFEFAFAVSEKGLFFASWGFHQPWLYDAPLGNYYEGLWERDVVELFVTEDDGVSYREIHLSPNGLWWNARFEIYRSRDEAFCRAPHPVPAVSRISASGWESALHLPAEVLDFDLASFAQKRANVSALFGPERSYLSYFPMHLSGPDFHRIDLFGPYIVIVNGFSRINPSC